MRGARKLGFGFIGLLFLAGGLALCLRPAYADAGKVLYGSFAAGVVGVVLAVIGGNVGEHVAQSKVGAAAATAAGALTREEIEKRVAAALEASRSGDAP
jgi:outer membrane lipoprotein SlyB